MTREIRFAKAMSELLCDCPASILNVDTFEMAERVQQSIINTYSDLN